MISFFSKLNQSNKPASFQHVEVDIHAHWLTGVDDGADSLETSIALIRGLLELGFRKLIATPHIMLEHYPNQPKKLRQVFQATSDYIRSQGINVELELAAEYMLDEGFLDQLDSRDVLSIGDRYLLVEFPMHKPFPLAGKFIERILESGYTPVLAHPERYSYYRRDIATFKELINQGALLQLNLLSLSGHYGKEVANWGRHLLEDRLYHFVGSDLHRASQLADYRVDLSLHQFLNAELMQTIGS